MFAVGLGVLCIDWAIEGFYLRAFDKECANLHSARELADAVDWTDESADRFRESAESCMRLARRLGIVGGDSAARRIACELPVIEHYGFRDVGLEALRDIGEEAVGAITSELLRHEKGEKDAWTIVAHSELLTMLSNLRLKASPATDAVIAHARVEALRFEEDPSPRLPLFQSVHVLSKIIPSEQLVVRMLPLLDDAEPESLQYHAAAVLYRFGVKERAVSEVEELAEMAQVAAVRIAAAEMIARHGRH